MSFVNFSSRPVFMRPSGSNRKRRASARLSAPRSPREAGRSARSPSGGEKPTSRLPLQILLHMQDPTIQLSREPVSKPPPPSSWRYLLSVRQTAANGKVWAVEATANRQSAIPARPYTIRCGETPHGTRDEVPGGSGDLRHAGRGAQDCPRGGGKAPRRMRKHRYARD